MRAAPRFAPVAAVALALLVAPTRAIERDQSDAVVQRMRAWLEAYTREQPAIVVEETYEQNRSGRGGPPERRVLVSDVLMLALVGDAGWLTCRDVVSVDGRAVPGRERRLLALLESRNGDAVAQARRIDEESARFNLGGLRRTVNVPDAAFAYLGTAHAGRMTLQAEARTSRVRDVDATVVRFRETGRPTIVRTPRGSDVPAEGRAWIDAASGALLRTELRLRDGSAGSVVTVDFATDARLGLVVPLTMVEEHRSRSEFVTATARYSNARRFTVIAKER